MKYLIDLRKLMIVIVANTIVAVAVSDKTKT